MEDYKVLEGFMDKIADACILNHEITRVVSRMDQDEVDSYIRKGQTAIGELDRIQRRIPSFSNVPLEAMDIYHSLVLSVKELKDIV